MNGMSGIYHSVTGGISFPIVYLTGWSGPTTYPPYLSWDQHTIKQRTEEAMEYIMFLRESRARLKEIIEG